MPFKEFCMKTPSALLAFALAATIASLCHAQQMGPLTPPAAVKPSSSAGDQIVKEVSFNDTPLDQVIEFLKDACPGFQAVISHDTRYPDYHPVVTMSLKNLPLNQILEVIAKSLPELRVDKVSSSKADVWIFRIRRVIEGGQPTAAAELPNVMVYRLSPLIRANASDRSNALNDILSLVQAALDATGSNQPSLMKVHAPTETLIFRGHPTQLEAVSRTLQALEPTPAESGRSKELERAKEEISRIAANQFEQSLAQARAETAELRKRLSQQNDEIQRLQAQLRSTRQKSQ